MLQFFFIRMLNLYLVRDHQHGRAETSEGGVVPGGQAIMMGT